MTGLGPIEFAKIAWTIHKPEFFRSDEARAAATYGGIAMADPKAPVEIRAMGPALWTLQVATVTSAMYVADPLQLREGGLDDVFYASPYPFFDHVSQRYQQSKDWLSGLWYAPAPNPWEVFWQYMVVLYTTRYYDILCGTRCLYYIGDAGLTAR